MTTLTKAALITELTTNFPDNTTGLITPAILRSTQTDQINSWQQPLQINAQSGTSYAVATSDNGLCLLFSNAAAVAVSLSSPGTAGFNPFSFQAKNNGTNTVTITPASSTIDGNASLVLQPGSSCWIISDGTNWRTGIFSTGTFTSTPTFTSVTSPLIIGGTLANSSLVLESTSGAGTTDLISLRTGSQLERLRIDTNGIKGFTRGAFGYAIAGNGDGGTVTQATSKSTGVTLNTTTGQITTNNAALANNTSGAPVSFTLTNNKIAVGDVLLLSYGAGATAGAYQLNAVCANGSAVITITNTSFFGTLGEAFVINFILIKAVTT